MPDNNIYKIAIVGPESTGKSTLCKQLAEHYGTGWVPEYAREYLEARDSLYKYEDLYQIALGQMASEDDACNRNQLRNHNGRNKAIFIDTELLVIKVWSEFVFNRCDNRILTEMAKRNYSLYLLCDTDLPWEPDPLREYPGLDARQQLFHHYREALVNQPSPWITICGDYSERLRQAIAAVDALPDQ